ncbi:UNVERIFIED_CONTAM: hypothetical protein Slati_3973200 [Sesamum latifolium]|uniref:Uncharacterized protein n=1 Tax=Sesamum latifolium TaxID=2727402 RepID=A0AAW2TQS5_9LAMI
MNNGGSVDPGAAVAIIVGSIIVVFASVCLINACNRHSATPQTSQTATSSGQQDGDVVIDVGEAAQAAADMAIEMQGCCCGGGGGDGGGCGGCGGD